LVGRGILGSGAPKSLLGIKAKRGGGGNVYEGFRGKRRGIKTKGELRGDVSGLAGPLGAGPGSMVWAANLKSWETGRSAGFGCWIHAGRPGGGGKGGNE